MNYAKRLETFDKVRAEHSVFLTSVLWKLTGDRELFTEALQYALLSMWQHVAKLRGKKAKSYIYRIALSANSKAWHDRIRGNGHVDPSVLGIDGTPDESLGRQELAARVRQAIAQLPARQGRAIVMRYLEQHDYPSIAERLRCTQAGARSHVCKALAALKTRLANVVIQER
jgi:RNA polymerase sigma factor (sigma-70 family)